MLTSFWPRGNDGLIWTLLVVICMAKRAGVSCDVWAQINTFLSSLNLLWHGHVGSLWSCVPSWFFFDLLPRFSWTSLAHVDTPSPLWGLIHSPRALGPHLASFFLSLWSQIKCYLLRITSSHSFLWSYVVMCVGWHFGVCEGKIPCTWHGFHFTKL